MGSGDLALSEEGCCSFDVSFVVSLAGSGFLFLLKFFGAEEVPIVFEDPVDSFFIGDAIVSGSK